MDDPFGTRIATINLNVNYLRPATGDLVATADVIRVGGSVGVSEITVESTAPDGETKAVAIGQGRVPGLPRELDVATLRFSDRPGGSPFRSHLIRVRSRGFASVSTLGCQESAVSTRRRAMENATTSANGTAYR